MKNLLLATTLALTTLMTACGGGDILVQDDAFQPKIVIQSTLFPGQHPEVILRRNFPLDVRVDENEIILRDAQAAILDEDGNRYPLFFNFEKQLYQTHEFIVDYGQTYTLEVSANIDGHELSARSSTTVPLHGLEILEEKSRLDSMIYRQRGENGKLIYFEVVFNRAPGTTFYAASMNALDADTATFIYDNPFGDIDVDDVLNDFTDFKYTYDWLQDTPPVAGESSIEIFSFYTWFYGDYRAIIYAGDRNFKDFLVTHNNVQEIDGNFHEPAFHIEGDGIGVFGSAVADTAYFTVLRN